MCKALPYLDLPISSLNMERLMIFWQWLNRSVRREARKKILERHYLEGWTRHSFLEICKQRLELIHAWILGRYSSSLSVPSFRFNTKSKSFSHLYYDIIEILTTFGLKGGGIFLDSRSVQLIGLKNSCRFNSSVSSIEPSLFFLSFCNNWKNQNYGHKKLLSHENS